MQRSTGFAHVCNFQGYIHVKAIPGADQRLIERTGYLADRMSVNIELPTAEVLSLLAPHKSRKNILTPIASGSEAVRTEPPGYHSVPEYPAGCAGRTEHTDDYRSHP